MNAPGQLVCLLTAGHVSSTPRVIKEADALCAAGYRVHVVAGRNFAPADALDEELLREAPWTLTRLDSLHGPGVFTRKAVQRLARQLVSRVPSAGVRLAARVPYAGALAQARLAARVRADFYLGHQLAGLPMAALAADAVGVPFGFDLEDFHDGETEEARRDPALSAAIRVLQTRLLPRCRHLTAASPLIAQKYRECYQVNPLTVLNVFPLAQAPVSPMAPEPASPGQPAVLYWFSQTVGPKRGLEAMIAAAGLMRTPVEFQLRGNVWPDYRERLERLARQSGLRRPIRFLPLAHPREMARLAAHAHLGLATEEAGAPNRDLCLANKNFIYLLAGVPQLLSSTEAHRALAPDLGEAAQLIDLTQPREIARQVDEFLGDPARQARARAAAWRLARERYCWDLEQEKFLDSFRRALK